MSIALLAAPASAAEKSAAEKPAAEKPAAAKPAAAKPAGVKPAVAKPSAAKPAVEVKLASNGRALLPVVVAAGATPRVQELAASLATYLGRISSGEFKTEVREAPLAPDAPGIVVALHSQVPGLKLDFDPTDPKRREDYVLRSHRAGVLLAGTTETAVQHAVWDFLYRLGHRQYFPGEKWEVVPRKPELAVAIDTMEHPDYFVRRFGPNYGNLPENRAGFDAWTARNRIGAGIDLKTGHAYDAIIRRNRAEFERHPEYLANPLDSPGEKFCVSNPGLRRLVVEDALRQMEKDPTLHSVSMDPSDLGNWDSGSCPDDKVYKNITDRAVTLANEVAAALQQKYPGTLVGMYAYNEHSPPPTIPVHPNVVVSIATAFVRGGYTVDELIAGWSKKAKVLGIREYYSVHTWARDLPGQPIGGNVEYLKTTLPHFHKHGARFMTSEASNNWGPNGLGYYIASRLLWDVEEAARVDELRAEFLRHMFPGAEVPMREYYRLIDGTNGRPLLSSDLIGRMYRHLREALDKTQDPAARARLQDLALYTRYSEMFMAYNTAIGVARQPALEAVLRYGWRIRTTNMIDAIPLFRDVAARDKQVTLPAEASYFVPAPKNPWKSDEPFTAEQVQAFITQGIANNAIVNFTPVQYSRDLVPATPLKLVSRVPGKYVMSRSKLELYTWKDRATPAFTLQARAGLVYGNLGDARLALYPLAQTMGEAVAEQSVKPDKEVHAVKLTSEFEGLHRILVTDAGAGTELTWPAGTPITIESSLAVPGAFYGGRWSMYFYVPKGTRVVGGYRDRSGVGPVLDGDGKLVTTLTVDGAPGYFSIPVPPGQDGKLWKFDSTPGHIMLMTVPPFFARSADELLLPREVVAADGE